VPAAGSVPIRWGLGDFVWIYVAGIIASVVGASIGFAITGDTSAHIGAVTTALSTFGQFGTWFALVVLIARSKGRSVREDFGLTLQLRDWWAPFAGLGLFLLGSALIYPLVNIVNAHQQVVDDLERAGGAKLAVFAVVAAVVAPICEELLFRGLLLRALRRRMSPTMAVIVQALAFALAHPMLSPTLGDFAVVPALFLLGAVSGVVAVRRGDLSASILMHIGFNLVTTLLAL
jgi:membrane protease YdiL (CAAX protease family)